MSNSEELLEEAQSYIHFLIAGLGDAREDLEREKAKTMNYKEKYEAALQELKERCAAEADKDNETDELFKVTNEQMEIFSDVAAKLKGLRTNIDAVALSISEANASYEELRLVVEEHRRSNKRTIDDLDTIDDPKAKQPKSSEP
jgi:methyl-accepting chemotaxis protein